LPVPGLVTLTAKGQEIFYLANAGANGAFRVLVPPGTYSLTGTSSKVLANGHEMLCQAAQTVNVRPGNKTLGVRVVCAIK
jgi:hypothetical protein